MEFVINQLRSLNQKLSARFRLPPAEVGNNPGDGGWFLLIIGYCLTSAIAISLEYWQLSFDHRPKIPPPLLLLSVALILAFSATFAARIITLHHPDHRRARLLLERVGVFFVAATFFIAITAPFPLYLKFISLVIFVASLLAVVVYVIFPGGEV